MKLGELKDKKVLILGFGREGRDTLKFLKKLFPRKVIGIADQKQFPISNFQLSNVKLHFGENYLKAFKNYDIIIKSPGIPIHLPEVEKAYKEGKIISPTEIFLENCPGRIIGITGTKGKSTTAFWIYQTLKKSGLSVKLVGNIGKPALSSLLGVKPQDIFVYELSSHQLYNVKKSPHIAVLLNIYPEHMDYYKSFKEYGSAKANIAKYQTKKDYFIYNSQDKICKKIANDSRARKIPIQGEYYDLNIAAARAVAKIFNAPMLKKFENLPHRLEFAGEFKKIKFYNDSLSTIPETAIFALDELGKDVQTLISGGFDRGQDFKNLARRILNSKIKNIILFPPSGLRIWQEISRIQKNRKTKEPFFVSNMADAVKLSLKYTAKGKICLLSPASASFGIFQDYRQRGDLFKKYVDIYGRQ